MALKYAFWPGCVSKGAAPELYQSMNRVAAEMAVSIYAVNNGYFDKVDRKKVVDAEAALQSFAKTAHKGTLDAINAEPVLKKHEAALKALCEDFVKNGVF